MFRGKFKKILLSSIVILLVFSIIGYQKAESKPENVMSLVEKIDYGRIKEDMIKIRNFGSLVTGYPGAYRAAKYILDTFKQLGYNSSYQKYKLAVPIEKEAYLLVEGKKIPVHALWPNLVALGNTPPEGITGRLIYVGKGRLQDFNGLNVNGSIVLMDFDTGLNWLNAIRLGAKAVIFVESENMLSFEAMRKILLNAPLDFPRAYIDLGSAEHIIKLLNKGEKIEATFVLKMEWKLQEAYNVVGVLEGESENDIIVVSTHYDTWNIVSALPSSVDEQTSIATFLELARLLSNIKPKRTIVFVAYSGHWQGLAGAREFVRQYVFPTVEKGKKVWLEIGIDLSTDFQGVSLVYMGYWSKYGLQSNYINRYYWIRDRIEKIYWPAVSDYVLKHFNIYHSKIGDISKPFRIGFQRTGNTLTYPWWDSATHPYTLDTEVSFVAGLPSFTIRTQHSHRIRWHVPEASLEYVDIENLKTQIPTVLSIIYGFATDEEWGLNWNLIRPAKWGLKYEYKTFQGFVTVYGEVVEYNFTSGWYSDIGKPSLYRMRSSASIYPFAAFYNFTDPEGRFIVNGIPPYDPTGGVQWLFDAWVLDENGKVIWATNTGWFGTQYTRTIVSALQPIAYVTIPVTPAIDIALLDIIDPQTLRRMSLIDWRYMDHSFLTETFSLNIFDFNTGAAIYMGTAYVSPWEGVAVAYIPPGYKVGFMIYRSDIYGRPIPLINGSKEHREGVGYLVQKRIILTSRDMARDIVFLVKERYSKVALYQFRSYSAEFMIRNASYYYSKALSFYKEKIYDQSYMNFLKSWMWGSRAYTETMTLIDDTGRTSVFFFFIILVGAILLERLTISFRDKRAIFSVASFTVGMLVLFYFVHPALRIMSMSYIAILGIITLLVFSIIAFIFFGEGIEITKKISTTILGYHEYEVPRVSIMVSSASISVENLKKRPLRTILTLVNIIVVVAALVSLSSVSYYSKLSMVPQIQKATYNGFFFKETDIPIWYDRYLMDYLRDIVGDKGVVYGRIWLYPEAWFPQGAAEIVTGKRSTLISAFLGLVPEEAAELLRIAGSAESAQIKEPFLGGTELKCIISDATAKDIGVGLGDTIRMWGLNFTVVGIIDTHLLLGGQGLYRELDGYPIVPSSPEFVPDFEMIASIKKREVFDYKPIPWERMIIIPYDLAQKLGGYPATMSVRLKNSTTYKDALKIARDIVFPLAGITVYFGWDGKTFLIGQTNTFLALGLHSLIVLFIIAAANIMITMLGSVKERTKEINVYSVVGMSPTDIAVLFISEGIVLALVGSVLGFFLGYGLDSIFYSLGILPSYFIRNYASFLLIIGIILSILAVIIPSIYPGIIASRSVTPSLERKWKITSKPRGDLWEVTLPLSVHTRKEIIGILRYLKEYYSGRGAVEKNFTVTNILEYSEDQMYLKFRVHLAPFELNLYQTVTLQGRRIAGNYTFIVILQRETGQRHAWIRSNRIFIDKVRKQLLVWRTLPTKIKDQYVIGK